MGRSSAIVYLWVMEEDFALQIETDEAVVEGTATATWRSPMGYQLEVAEARATGQIIGVWTVRVQNTAEAPVDFRLHAEGVYPFMIPGPGIVPSHFTIPEPKLRLLGSGRGQRLWFDVPGDVEMVTLQTWLPVDACPTATAPDGTHVALEWLPAKCAYHAAQLVTTGRAGWWSIPFEAPERECQFTIWEGLPLFFEPPPSRFPYARIEVESMDETGAAIDARVEVFQENERLTILDALAGETAVRFVPPGSAEVRVSCGFERVPAIHCVRVHSGSTTEIQSQLRPYIQREDGWVCGDHHLHSWREDGGQSPETIARAARAAGLDYAFITDRPEPVMDDGCQQHNLPGKFLAMPGQELGNPDCHMNALNTRQTLDCPEYGEAPADYPGAAEWLPQVAAQSSDEHPTALMLNHPTHVPETMERHAYFRSWWVADEHDEIVLVENCDFDSWFERLNAGRRAVVLWTTDSHDVAFLPPGDRRTYVHVGRDLTEQAVLDGLLAGRCFNTRRPGALLFLTVSGAMPGQVVPPGSEELDVEIRCRATRLIERVELVGDGRVLRMFRGMGSMTLDAKTSIAGEGLHWLIARAYVMEEPMPENGHTGTPFDRAGCVAFTNPVFCDGTRP